MNSLVKHLSTLLLLSLVLAGCSEPIHQLAGSYSYKAGGVVAIDDVSTTLKDEIGALDVIRRQENQLQLVFNVLGGSVYTTTATLDGSTLTLDPFSRRLIVGLSEYEITISGQAEWLDGMLIFTLAYNGKNTDGNRLESNTIQLIAKQNR